MTQRDSEPFPERLLSADDADPMAIVNPGGKAPIVFIADHAGREFPRRLGRLGLALDALDHHIAWDIGIAPLARHMVKAFDAIGVLALHSRLVIDCNRRPDDPTSIPQESDGIAVPGNRGLSPADREARVREIFEPYHAAIAAALQVKRRNGVAPVLVSLHSFTPTMNGKNRPWHVGILWNRDERLPRRLLDLFAAEPGLCVGDNEPYSGRDNHGFSIQYHAESQGLAHALIEIRQDLIASERDRLYWWRLIERVLRAALDEPSLYREPL